MHNITNTVSDILTYAAVSVEDRKMVTELLVAEALGVCLPIPSSPTDAPNNLFLSLHKLKVVEKLCQVNESIVIDVDRACDLVYNVWLARYRLVHCPNDSRVTRLVELAIRSECSSIPNDVAAVLAKYPKAKIGKYILEKSDEVNCD